MPARPWAWAMIRPVMRQSSRTRGTGGTVDAGMPPARAGHMTKEAAFHLYGGGHFSLNSRAQQVIREIRQFVAECGAVTAE
ncbi:hypothetical protein GCM10010269_68090 [Streptomyces humidus]|uniref:Uncharacterized protein n=1 Tax=Streptomyces humidus TaxID=52259 RepID=A0A918L807_9ACTN|nr:hypothetical protein GCM10010269_68090 [Streptomyces humidus]